MSRSLSASSLVNSSLGSCVPAPDPAQWLPAGNLGRLSGGTPRRPGRQRDSNPRLVRQTRTRAAYATHVPRERGPKFRPIYRTSHCPAHCQTPSSIYPASDGQSTAQVPLPLPHPRNPSTLGMYPHSVEHREPFQNILRTHRTGASVRSRPGHRVEQPLKQSTVILQTLTPRCP